MATVSFSLFYKSFLCSHFLGGTIPLLANNKATVLLLLSYIVSSWSQILEATKPFLANNNATVSPLIYKSGLCLNSDVGLIPLEANHIANVKSFSFF